MTVVVLGDLTGVADVSVFIGETSAINVTILSVTELTCVLPGLPVGSYPLIVILTDAQGNTEFAAQ